MSIRIKISMVIGLTFLALLGIIYYTSQWFLLQNAKINEEKSTTRDVARLLEALDGQIEVLDASVGDWAPWDDTYEFILSGDTGYIDSNLPNETFTNLGVELMLFINNSGQIVFGKLIDIDNGTEISLPESLYSELQVGNRLLSHKDPADKMAGILSLPEGPMIIASQPILTSLDEGPIRGTLIMGRFLDDVEIAKLSQRIQLSIKAFPLNDDVLPGDVALARNSLVGVNSIIVAPQSESVVSGYTQVNDVYGKPALILRVDTPREAHTQAKMSVGYLGAALVVIGIVLGLVMMLMIERMVITRLTGLNSSVMKIGSQGTVSSRVEANGNDEIYLLATSVNSMLDSLENSRMKELESEQRFKNLAIISPVGIFRTDQNGATTYVNPMWCQISGMSVDEALGDGWLNAVHPEDKKRLTEGWRETTRHKKESIADYRFIRSDGSVAWVLGQTKPELNSKNQIVGYVGTITDITERKRADEILKSYSEHLQKEVEQRTSELVNAQEKLIRQERLAMLGQVAGSISHELRNPLCVISNAVYFLKLVQPDADEKVREYIGMIEKEVGTAEKIITDLLDFGRIKSMERQAVNVAGLVQQTQERFPIPPSVRVNIEIPPDLPLVYADSRQMTQVLGNLIVNACQSMPEGGNLDISAILQDSMVSISIQDTGEGISPENMGKLFEPLFTTKAKGIGLGLPVSRTLVESHGGRIEVQSELGIGSTFTVYLPITIPEVSAP